jgi:hypothetical protein
MRFDSVYPRIIKRATGDRNSVSLFIKPVVIINRAAFTITKNAAALVLIFPVGIYLFFVLGLRASKLLSASRLNPIAALRAKIIQSITSRRSFKLNTLSVVATARAKPIMANGIAKTVWLNLTREK